MTVIDAFRGVHVVAGGAALASFWIPMVAAKGGRVHRFAGRVFVVGMTIVSATALVLAGARLAEGGGPGAQVGAIFLGYLGVLAGEGTYRAIRALRTKTRTTRTDNPLDLAFAGLVAALGVPTVILGWTYSSGLVVAFGLVGVVGGLVSLRYWWTAPLEPMHWWYEHMGAAAGTSIAAITAFLVQNTGKICPDRWAIVAWLAPSLVGVPLLIAAQIYYRRRFTPPARAAA